MDSNKDIADGDEGEDKWHFIPCFPLDIINMRDDPDPYLTSVCHVVKKIILSKMHKKDLDLISEIILYTFSRKDVNSLVKEEKFEKAAVRRRSIFAGAAAVTGRSLNSETISDRVSRSRNNTIDNIDSANGKMESVESDPILEGESSDMPQPSLDSSSMLRVYLLRLLFTLYLENIKLLRCDADGEGIAKVTLCV